MKLAFSMVWAFAAFLFLATGCTVKSSGFAVNKDTVQPGGIVQRGMQQFHLLGTPVQVGKALPDTDLVNAFTMEEYPLSRIRGKIAVISIVPSLDTKVCETQTHYLGERGKRLPKGILRVTISRDTPFAQKRFAEEAKLTDMLYLSDYREGAFGMATGLLIDESRLLARSVIVVDWSGIIRYLQVVPQLGELPDLDRAFEFVTRMAGQQP